MDISRCLKEELAWAIDQRFQFTISYYTILLETCKEAIGYSHIGINNFQLSEQFLVIPNAFENEKVHRGRITKGLLYNYVVWSRLPLNYSLTCIIDST